MPHPAATAMQDLADALTAAARSLAKPRMLGLVIWPLLAAALLWVALGWFAWHQALTAVGQLTPFKPLNEFLAENGLGWLAGSAMSLILALMLPTLVATTALLVTAIIAMPVMVRHVAALEYPELAHERGGTFAGGLVNAVVAALVYLLLWLLLLPVRPLVPFAFVLPILLNGYLNDRVFRHDALAEHATSEEYRAILHHRKGSLFGLGLVAALIQCVPIVNLISPVYCGLAFIHFALAELRKIRSATSAAPLARPVVPS